MVKGFDELNAKLQSLSMSVPDLLEKGLTQGAAIVEAKAKGYAPYESGTFRRSINYRTKEKSLNSVIIEVGTNLKYARLQEFGGTIKAKNKPFLIFRTKDGRWVKTKSVYVPPHPYMTPAMDESHDLINAAFKFKVESILAGESI